MVHGCTACENPSVSGARASHGCCTNWWSTTYTLVGTELVNELTIGPLKWVGGLGAHCVDQMRPK
jgi:hypothetical protein